MKKIFTLSAFLVATVFGFCQSPTKFDFYLAAKQQAYLKTRTDGADMLQVLVKGNIRGIQALVDKNGGVFKYSYGNIAAIKIPVSALPAFYYSSAVERMEGKPPHIEPLNDTMRMKAHIVEVQMGQAPLTKPYKGKGIVIGMIDTGIDFVHADFRDSTGKSRIQSIWDMNQPVGPFTPSPYGYGQAWDKNSIDTALATNDSAVIAHMDSAAGLEFGHGSHVSGVAAGNGLSNGLSIGAAPEADIMMVAYNFSNQTNNEMTDAVSYLYNKADALGEPCVINASLGDYDGSHDGQDLQALMIDSMITAKPGRVFVAAAGNESNIRFHLGYSIATGDTAFTWFAYHPSNGNIYFDAWADTANFKNIQFSIGVDKRNPFTFRAQTAYANITANLGNIITDTVKNKAGNRLGIVQTYTQLVGSTYSLEVQISPDSTTYYWRLSTTGSGKFDCWYPDPTPIVDTGLPSASVFPAIKNYRMPDTISTLCSSFQCSPNVITVGDYYNHKTILDYDTVIYARFGASTIEDNLTYYSGVGPTRDGRIKPDIASPGDICLSVLPTMFRKQYIANSPTSIDIGGYHFMDGGTSTACPGVAGVAALYLELHPAATNTQVKNAIIYCSDEDKFTGSNLPNNSWGYGKVDAFKALTGCGLGTPQIKLPAATLLAYPNPMAYSSVITYDFSGVKGYCTSSIEIYDVMGKKIKTFTLKNDKGYVFLNRSELSSGMYFYTLVVDGKRLNTQKLIVE